MSFYDYTAKKMNGKEIKMRDYQGKVIVVVNTASKCGFTPQFASLEALYKKYKDSNFAILGFPCNQFASQDPDSNDKIEEFCKINYGVTFDMFQKIDVNGEEAHPLYKYLKEQAKGLLGKDIKWNFTKFLVDKQGKVIKRYSSAIDPKKMEKDIIKLLN